jgi:hypothetical protein
VSHSTITRNGGATPTVDRRIGLPPAPIHAAIAITDGAATFRSTILAANTPANCAGLAPGTLSSGGTNLDSATSCAFVGAGDLASTDPFLDVLADNGGSTKTRALKPGSPAIDVAAAAGCPASDQRGTARPQGAGCDIGAYERVPPTPPPSPSPAPSPSPSPAPGATPTPSPAPTAAPVRTVKPSELLAALPSKHGCARRKRFRFRLELPHGVTVTTVRLYVGKKRVASRSNAGLKQRVDLRRYVKGAFTVRITMTIAGGRTVQASRHYQACKKR